jgi:CheY-like chemotaxis protein
MTLRILIADDDRLSSTIAKDILESHGYQVVQAFDGQASLDAVAEGRPDVILLDLIMPLIDGWEVLYRLHSGPNSDIPVVIVSSLLESESALEHARQLGVLQVLHKPVPPRDLVDAVERVVRARVR